MTVTFFKNQISYILLSLISQDLAPAVHRTQSIIPILCPYGIAVGLSMELLCGKGKEDHVLPSKQAVEITAMYPAEVEGEAL